MNPANGRLTADVKVNGKTYPKDGMAYDPLLDGKFWEGEDNKVLFRYAYRTQILTLLTLSPDWLEQEIGLARGRGFL